MFALLMQTLPEDLQNLIYKKYFTKYVLINLDYSIYFENKYLNLDYTNKFDNSKYDENL